MTSRIDKAAARRRATPSWETIWITKAVEATLLMTCAALAGAATVLMSS